MSKKRKGQLTSTTEWAKHLRKYLKRQFWKAERKAGKKLMKDESSRPSFEIRMISIENYFKRNIKNDKSFEPGFIAVKEINKYALKEQVTKDDLLTIVKIFNDSNQMQHYKGTGWMDLQMHIQSLIERNNLDYKILSNKNIEII